LASWLRIISTYHSLFTRSILDVAHYLDPGFFPANWPCLYIYILWIVLLLTIFCVKPNLLLWWQKSWRVGTFVMSRQICKIHSERFIVLMETMYLMFNGNGFLMSIDSRFLERLHFCWTLISTKLYIVANKFIHWLDD